MMANVENDGWSAGTGQGRPVLLPGRTENQAIPGAVRHLPPVAGYIDPAHQRAAAGGQKQRTLLVRRKIAPFVPPSAVKTRPGCAPRRGLVPVVRMIMKRGVRYVDRETADAVKELARSQIKAGLDRTVVLHHPKSVPRRNGYGCSSMRDIELAGGQAGQAAAIQCAAAAKSVIYYERAAGDPILVQRAEGMRFRNVTPPPPRG